MKSIRRHFIICLLGAGWILSLCSCNYKQSGSNSATGASAQANFFAYPYSAQPQHYADVAVLSTGSGATSVQVVASMRDLSTGLTAPTNFSIQVTGPDGTNLCAVQTGTVTPPVTAVSFTCAGPGALPSPIQVALTMQNASGQQVVTKQF